MLSPEISMNDKQTHNTAAEQPQNNDIRRDSFLFGSDNDDDLFLLDRSRSRSSVSAGGRSERSRTSSDRDLGSSVSDDGRSERSSDRDLDSSASASGRSERSGGMLEAAEKGDKIISVSRFIFFGVLCVSAAVCASVAFWLNCNEETATFNKAVRTFVRTLCCVFLLFAMQCD